MTPSARTKHMLEACGFLVGKVEQRLHIPPKPGQPPKTWSVTTDLFGFADFCAVGFGRTLFVQATSLPNFNSRREKIFGETAANAIRVLECGNRIVLLAWGKRLTPDGDRVVARCLECVHDEHLSDSAVVAKVCKGDPAVFECLSVPEILAYNSWLLADGKPTQVLRRPARKRSAQS